MTAKAAVVLGNDESMIEIREKAGVLTVTLNRTEKANSLTAAMMEELIRALKTDAPGCNCLILTGRGHVFSAGADLDEARAGLATSPLWEELSGTIAGLGCLSIAALNGTLAGGAFGMALACDLRIAVPGAKFFYPVMRLGFLPQPSDPARMCALIGPARSKLLLMAGQKIDAQTALSWGLVDEIVKPDALMDRASELSEAVVHAEAENVAAIKSMIG